MESSTLFPGASGNYLATFQPTSNGATPSNNRVLTSHAEQPSSSNSTRDASPVANNLVLTIRLLMQGKEVGSIIGKRGDQIKKIREESGAKINISDGTSPERIVTITGTLNVIGKAFQMICAKFEEDMLQLPNSVPKPPITMRLIVPATQCGSLIGKSGSKIKEIREATGASIQVASEMLPDSSERAVTISGNADAINLCMAQVCQILLEAPPKGTTITYRPKPTFDKVAVASSAASMAARQAQQQMAAALLGGQIPITPYLQQQQLAQQLLNPELRAVILQQQQQQLGLLQQNPSTAFQHPAIPVSSAYAQQDLGYLNQNGLIYQQSVTEAMKPMEPWGYEMSLLQQQQQQQQQQQLMAQLALNQKMLIGAPFVKGSPASPTNAQSVAQQSQAGPVHQKPASTSANSSSTRFNPY